MKKISLKRLTIRDFQGGSFDLEIGNSDASVFGANAAGKTRLFSAFTYLLFGKDSLNRSDFSLKNLNALGEVADHGIQHTVEGVLDVDGEEVVLKKVYSEKFVKIRGGITPEFSGHSTQHFINSVPKAEKDYKAYIQEIAGDEQTFRILTSPTAFPLLPWQKQRALLLEIFGDVSDSDIIDSDPKLAELPKILGRHKADDYKKILAARQAELNKALGTSRQPGTIETRIDEVRRGLPDTTGLDRKEIAAEVFRLETAGNDAKLRLQGEDTGGAIASLSKQLAGINTDLQKMESTHYSETMKTGNTLSQHILELAQHLNSDRLRVSTIEGDLKRKAILAERINVDLANLRDKWTAADSQAFQDAIADTCASCGQSLPAERVQEARDKALASFNQQKAERLEEISARGLRGKEDNEQLQTEIDALTKEKDALVATIPGTEEQLRKVTTQRDSVKALAEDYATIPAREALIIQKAEVEAQIKSERDGRVQDAGKIREEITALSVQLTAAKANADKFIQRETGEKRLEELKSEEKKLAAEAERMASELYLIDLFTRAKVNMLNEKMTGQFEFVKWKLAEIQVNGAVNDQMCELTVNGIGYNSGLNSAARTQAGMDIIRTLQRHYGLSVVVWIDNRESCTLIPQMECQVISLYVSPEDKTLRIELAGTREEVAA